MPPHATVDVAHFPVADLTEAGAVEAITELLRRADGRTRQAFALHVGGLNDRHSADYVEAMRGADIVYADGGSVVLLAKLAGADSIERAPTTDIGWAVLGEFLRAEGRPARVAMIGGPEGLADRAGVVLAEAGVAEIVHTDHGFHQDWAAPLATLREAAPELVVVGLGAPREMIWTHEQLDRLPAALVLTCGGWFGHLVGDEARAPRLLRRSGLEWIARLAQSPRRLLPRYARGLWATGVVGVQTLLGRARRR